MKRILVTGAENYIGSALVSALLSRKKDFQVRAATRSFKNFEGDGLETVVLGEVENNPDYQGIFSGCDVVIHCDTHASLAGPKEQWSEDRMRCRIVALGTANLAREAHRAGVHRFVFLSSLEVNGLATPEGKRFYADSLPRPKSPLGLALYESEKELARVREETGMEVVIVRIPVVYGPQCVNLFGFARSLVRWCVPLPVFGCRKNRQSLVGIDNLTDFLMKAAVLSKAANETFLVSDGHDLSTLEIFRLLAKTGRRPQLFWYFPPIFLKLFNSYIGRQAWERFFFESRVVDIGKNRLLLNWTPPLSAEQSFRRAWEEEAAGAPSAKPAGGPHP